MVRGLRGRATTVAVQTAIPERAAVAEQDKQARLQLARKMVTAVTVWKQASLVRPCFTQVVEVARRRLELLPAV